jgi:hypothetical protein
MNTNYQIPFEDRLSFAKHHIAWGCFSRTSNLCKYLIDNKNLLKEEVGIGILSGICATYGKPFYKSHGISKFDEDIIPIEFFAIHNRTMHFRDKLFAHSDTDGKIESINAFLINIILQVKDNHRQWQSASPTPNELYLTDLMSLCKYLCDYCQSIIKKFNKNYIDVYRLKNGIYSLNIRDKNGPDFHRFKPDQ